MNNYKFTYIIDDDVIFVYVFKTILATLENFQNINTEKNGYEAIENLKKLDAKNELLPDIIFLDLNMPVLDGWQFLDELEHLSFKDKLNIHLISSSIDINDVNKSKKYKTVKSFIQKPTNAKQFIDSLSLL